MSISGDLRITPFCDVYEVKRRVTAYVEEINKNITRLPTRGPCSKYELPEEGLKGSLDITWGEVGFPAPERCATPLWQILIECAGRMKSVSPPS
eukprot:8579013-Pyramimonas_sp.AAC.1